MAKKESHPVEITDKILDKIATGVGVFDLIGGRFIPRYLNDGYYQMIGVPREERTKYFSSHPINAVYDDDRIPLLKAARAAIKDKTELNMQFRLLTKRGIYNWVGIHATHEKIDKKTERFYASYYNVDEYVRTQSQLEAYKKDLDGILGNIPTGVAVFSERNRKIHLDYTNAAYYTTHHGSLEYWVNQSDNPVNWLPKEERHLFRDEFKAVKEGKKELGSVVYPIVGEDGITHWIHHLFRKAYIHSGVQYYYGSFVDVDDQKATEEAKKKTQKIYESAVEEAKLAIWEYDIKNHIITMADNDFTKKDFNKFNIGKITTDVPNSIIKYIDDGSIPAFLKFYHDIDSGAPKASCEVWYRINGQNKEPRCERISYTTIFDKNNKPVLAYGVGQNITSQKRAQEEYLKLRNQLTNNLFGVVGSFQLNLSKNTFISGYSPFPYVVDQLRSKTANGHFKKTSETVIDPELAKKIFKECTCAKLLSVFKSGQSKAEYHYPIHTSSGGIMWVYTTLYMMQNPDTGDVELISYCKNETSQKRNEEIIRKMAEESCDFIGVIDAAGKTFELHDGVWERTHLPLGHKFDYDDIRRQTEDEYVRAEERKNLKEITDLPVLFKALEEKPQYFVSYNYFNANKEDENLKKQISFSWLNQEKKEILVIQQDVTETYRREQERITALEEARKKADEANSAKTSFLSTMSHDIRTPLNGIIGMTYLASQQTDNPLRTADCLKKIDTSSKFLLSLINDILDVSKAENSKIVMHPEPYYLREFNAYIDSLIRPLCEQKGQKFILDETGVVAKLVPVIDKLRFNQIIFNLLSNAVKYTPEGGTITYSISDVALDESHMKITHSVSDTGIGMSEEFQKHLFEPFTQENRAVASEAKGTGLGLSIVKKLVDMMGGNITVQSEIGKGSTFTVSIDLEAVPSKPFIIQPSAPTNPKDGSNSTIKGKRILVCEDNSLNREIAVALLNQKGVLTEEAENGQIGLDKFQKSPIGYFDCILMDIHMPIMDGYQATHLIRSLPRADALTINIIAMTADAFEEDVQKCLDAGMNAHIAKPIDPRQMIMTISSYLK